MIKAVNFKEEHLDQMLNRRGSTSLESLKENIRSMGDRAVVKTLVLDDKILGVLGFNLVHTGVIECWSILSDLIKDHYVSFHKSVLALLHYVEDKMKPHRVQVMVDSNFETGKKWAESLGFVCETILKMYGPLKQDYCVYVRLHG